MQHTASSSNDQNSGTGNDFKFTLPNIVGAGNALIMGLSFGTNPFDSTIAVSSITDSAGDSWSTTPAATVTGSTMKSQIFALANATSAVHTITVSLSTAVTLFQYTVSEFYNVDTASPINCGDRCPGLNAAVADGVVSTGSFTPGDNDANGGNLIWAYFANDSSPFATVPTAYAAGASFSLLDGSIGTSSSQMPHGAEYFVQARAAAINPRVTLTGGGADSWNGVAVALKAATAGTAPALAGIRILKIIHETHGAPPAEWTMQCPSSGNLIVIRTNEDENLTSITDSNNNRYRRSVISPQIWHADNASTSSDLKVTLHYSELPGNRTNLCYDISGADTAPEDGEVQNDEDSAPDTYSSYDVNDSPVITPASANGLTIAGLMMGIGPVSGFAPGSPPGAIYDFVYYAGEVDGDRMDSGDGAGHLYNSDLTVEHWNWRIPNLNCPGEKCSSQSLFISSAAHFKAAVPSLYAPDNPGTPAR